ncbi:pyruvate dehydrogenase E2 component (dihydrolipoamide acetyltransferase) [Sulfurivirga caldicuralii]|uniref:Acetyltransferase component of pyruvate dehydrogenase complex n=1 Tax=Sulfurivirga caldicuralii TaxID=364032 RepID=A0A1N6EWN2_9GAMM|nr:dihydrolipoyllysine-residue acetyltransferase [Sulfurivirga caldicuralii]SIN87469.1 pyruvate dehydrogenase E2 component (dihydrolipoamide acetyltransferase) [Sulfurivirga caldicuralii]
MTVKTITLPDIGDFDSVDVIEVLVQPGDTVDVDDSLITLESDKATMEVPSPYAGTITKVLVKEGDKVKEGDPIAEIEVADESTEPAPQPEAETPAEQKVSAEPAAQPEPAKPAAAAPAQPAAAQEEEKPVNAQPMGAKFHASPAVRAFARVLGVDLSKVTGTGPKGRITKEDIQQFVKSVMEGAQQLTPATGGAGIPAIKLPDFSQFGPVEEVELSRIKKLSGKHLHACWLNVPHVTQFDEADITELEAFRNGLKAQAEKEGVKITPLVFIMKAVVAALKQFPNMNASLSEDGERLIVKKYYNLGIAVDTPNGLVVPVVRDVDQKGIFELSRELMTLSTKAREGKLSPADMSAGTFTISSLGGIGGTNFTPIVNAPEVGIMGVSKAKMQPVWNGSDFEPRLMLPFSVSYDHRVIDGAEGVRFTQTVARYLSDIRQLIL